MANLHTLFVAYSKVGKLHELPYQCHIFLVLGFGKSFSTISKVILKDSSCENFFHYGSRKTAEIFAEFNHQFLNIFCIISSIVTF